MYDFFIGVIIIFISYLFIKKSKFDTFNYWLQAYADSIINGNYVILDTETTGLSDTAQILEIAVIDMKGNVLLNTLVNPTTRISAKAAEVHGISKQSLKNAPRWDAVYNQLNEAIGNRKVLTYNAKFDERLINQSCAAFEIKPTQRTFKCAMLLYAQWYGEINKKNKQPRWKKLTEAKQECKIKTTGEDHRALTDCMTTLGVMKHISTHRAKKRT